MWAWLPVMSLAEKVAQIPRNRSCPVDKIASVIEQAHMHPLRFSDALSGALDKFLTVHETELPGSTRFIRAELACQGEQAQALASCLCEHVHTEASPLGYWMPEDHTSQFRERETKLEPDMAWMERSNNHLAHIDLWVHTTFALHRTAFDTAEPQVNEASATALDFPADELASLRQILLAGLPNYVRQQLRTQSYDEFMAPVEDFVLVQRFMRAALAGSLGTTFPITKLLKLEADTRTFVPAQPTIKWEPVSSESDFRELLANADTRASNSYISWRQDMATRAASGTAICDRASN